MAESDSSLICVKLKRAQWLRILRIPKSAALFVKEKRAWVGMQQRCYNPNSKAYKSYGGKGVTVCQRWRNSFADFLADMGAAPSSDHSVDRIDPAGNYEPGNVRWATVDVQWGNTRRARRLPVYPKTAHSSGQARVKFRGHVYYLGLFGSQDSHTKFNSLCAVFAETLRAAFATNALSTVIPSRDGDLCPLMPTSGEDQKSLDAPAESL